jgi:hypothetical protein
LPALGFAGAVGLEPAEGRVVAMIKQPPCLPRVGEVLHANGEVIIPVVMAQQMAQSVHKYAGFVANKAVGVLNFLRLPDFRHCPGLVP